MNQFHYLKRNVSIREEINQRYDIKGRHQRNILCRGVLKYSCFQRHSLEKTIDGVLFLCSCSPKNYNFVKIIFHLRCFPRKFLKFFRKTILRNAVNGYLNLLRMRVTLQNRKYDKLHAICDLSCQTIHQLHFQASS